MPKIALHELQEMVSMDDTDFGPGEQFTLNSAGSRASISSHTDGKLLVALGPRRLGYAWVLIDQPAARISSLAIMAISTLIAATSAEWLWLLPGILTVSFLAWSHLAGRVVVIPCRFESGSEAEHVLILATECLLAGTGEASELEQRFPAMDVWARLFDFRFPLEMSPFR